MKEPFRVFKKCLSGIRQGDPAVDPVKEADIQRIFKVLDLDTHRRLGQVHLLGGLGYAQRPRRNIEDVYLVYVHNTPARHDLLSFNNIIREKYLT
jgi:hypothetical protein